jgi:hypothetical protein
LWALVSALLFGQRVLIWAKATGFLVVNLVSCLDVLYPSSSSVSVHQEHFTAPASQFVKINNTYSLPLSVFVGAAGMSGTMEPAATRQTFDMIIRAKCIHGMARIRYF